MGISRSRICAVLAVAAIVLSCTGCTGGDAGKGSASESEAYREVKFFETRTNPFLEANAGKSGESPNGNHSDGSSGDARAKAEKLLESNASSYEDGAFVAFTSLGEFQFKLTKVDRSARYPDDPDTELVTVSYDGTNRSDLRQPLDVPFQMSYFFTQDPSTLPKEGEVFALDSVADSMLGFADHKRLTGEGPSASSDDLAKAFESGTSPGQTDSSSIVYEAKTPGAPLYAVAYSRVVGEDEVVYAKVIHVDAFEGN